MPIDLRLAAVPTAGETPLASHLAAAGGGEDLAIAVQHAAEAGVDSFLPAPAAELIAAYEVTGRAGELAQVADRLGAGVRRILFLGLGEGSPAEMRAAGAALARRLTTGRPVLTSAAWNRPDQAVRAFAEGLLLGSYRFSLSSQASPQAPPTEVRVLLSGGGQPEVLERASAAARAVTLARDLANMPANVKSPRWLADEARKVAAVSGLDVTIWEPDELAAAGFGGLLAVGSGSAQPPALIELGYQPPGWREHVVLIGKGVTFDSGGLSLKPNDGMQLMKTDMAGGAAVIAVMSALARVGAGVRVTGLIPAAENMPSGAAQRPGDVITHYGGRTTEVLNTDAEGRLILADALAYAHDKLAPDAMVDIATLTGAARVALGTSMGALYSSDDGLAEALLSAAADSGEPLWRMPLVGDYASALESPVADLANVPWESPGAGSITAALFLREFAGGCPWAHLDVAGAARSLADEGEVSKGATGFGTRLLLRWLSHGLGLADAAMPAVPATRDGTA